MTVENDGRAPQRDHPDEQPFNFLFHFGSIINLTPVFQPIEAAETCQNSETALPLSWAAWHAESCAGWCSFVAVALVLSGAVASFM
ncbi:MAG: hypothetical protein R3F11_10325 [Verrucomicrobiales bacterium]